MYKVEVTPKLAATHVAELLGISLQAIHKQLKQSGLQCPKIGNKTYITHLIGRKLFNTEFDKKKIAFHIVKGGTGKTTALHNISCAASVYGARILLVDLDPQANLTDVFNINADDVPVLIDVITGNAKIEECIINIDEGIDIIPSRIENVVLDSTLAINRNPLDRVFSNHFETIENNYDFIFIDCPPMIGHSVTAATLYADLIVSPLNPDKFSAKGLKILKEEINNIKKQYKRTINYKVFLNKFSANTILSDKAIHTTIANESESGNALTTAIRQSQEIPNATDLGFNTFSNLAKSTSRDDFDLLARELLNIDVKRNKPKIQAAVKKIVDDEHIIDENQTELQL